MASDLPVDLLEEIFLRLDDAADLARASATCASFRRVDTAGRFLRHFRSLHRRPVLGLLLETGRLFCPAQWPPWRRQAAGGFARAADFTFTFLHDRSRWRVCDARDGRVLLTRCRGPHYTFEDLVLYDPLHRRHVQIPTILGDLLLSASANDPNKQGGNVDEDMTFDDPFLAPVVGDERDDDDDEGFRVMCTTALLSKTKVVLALAFSSATGQWRCVASFTNPSHAWTNISLPSVWSRQYVHSCFCFCWSHQDANDMLVFDTREMKFSIADLPRESNGSELKMAVDGSELKMAVEAGDGRLGLLVVSNRSRSATMDLYSTPWQGQGSSIQEPEERRWQHDSSVPMRGFNLTLAGAAEAGYVLLRGVAAKRRKRRNRPGDKKPEAHYFTMELKTLLVQKLCLLGCRSSPSFLYASFPPPFSPPRV